MREHNYFVYITTNPKRNILYVGVTNNLTRRMSEHFANKGKPSSFAGKYYCYNLIYYEHFTDIRIAIQREKQIKKWSRKKKVLLIERTNAEWRFFEL